MKDAKSISAFLAFCRQRNPRFVRPIPRLTSYEQMLVDLDHGDPAVLTAFIWAQRTLNVPAEAVRSEWRHCAEIERAGFRRVVWVSHVLAAPPSSLQVKQLRAALGGVSPELLEFYQLHNGADLFVDIDDSGSGLLFFPIAEMEAERVSVSERLEQPTMETVEDGSLQIYGSPHWLHRAVAFGGFGYVPERLLLPTDGEYRGNVFLFSHDPLKLLIFP